MRTTSVPTVFRLHPIGTGLGLVAALVGLASAQEPAFTHARVETHNAPSGLEKSFLQLVNQQAQPAWIGYSVPIVPGNYHICCYSSEDRLKPGILHRGQCRLEGHDDGMNFQTNDSGEGDTPPGRLLVLFRVADRAVGRIRVFTEDCELDAGDLAVHWLTGIHPAESIELLASFVGGAGPATHAEERKREIAI